MNYFANNIKYLRKVYGIKQADLAKKIGKTANTVSNWEQGIRQPIVADVIILCQYFNVDFDDLLNKDLALAEDFTLQQRLNRLEVAFRRLNDEQQDAVLQMVESMVK